MVCKSNDLGAVVSMAVRTPLPSTLAGQHQSVGIENIGLSLEFKAEERKRRARLVFSDFLVKLLQGRLELFDVSWTI